MVSGISRSLWYSSIFSPKAFLKKDVPLPYFTFCTIKNSLNSPNILAIPIFANIVPIVRIIFTHIRSATDWVAFHRERVYAHI